MHPLWRARLTTEDARQQRKCKNNGQMSKKIIPIPKQPQRTTKQEAISETNSQVVNRKIEIETTVHKKKLNRR